MFTMLTLTSVYAEDWGQCKSGPYHLIISANLFVSEDILSCFDYQTLIKTDNLDEAKKTFEAYSLKNGVYNSFRNFNGDKESEEFCKQKFSLPVRLQNYSVTALGRNEDGLEDTCDVKYFQNY